MDGELRIPSSTQSLYSLLLRFRFLQTFHRRTCQDNDENVIDAPF